MDFFGKIKDLKVTRSVEHIEPSVQITIETDNMSTLEELEKIKDKPELSISVKRPYNKRSLDANAYFHLLVNKLARHFNIPDEEMKIKMNLQYGTVAKDSNGNSVGVKIPTTANIKDFYKYAKWFGTCKENGLEFDKYLFYKETHTLSSAEMAKLIDGVVQECQDYGIPTKEEDEIKAMVENWGKEQKQ